MNPTTERWFCINFSTVYAMKVGGCAIVLYFPTTMVNDKKQ